MKTIFFIFFVFSVSAQNIEHLPFQLLDSIESPSFNSKNRLPFLDSVLKNKRIVLLGEPTHGEGNVFVVKTNLIKYLHEKLGFNVIAFESSFYNMFMAQKQSLATQSFEPMKAEIYPIWRACEECTELFDYLAKEKNLKIVGFDNQLGGNLTESLIDSLQNYLRKYKIENNAIDWSEMDEIVMSMGENFSFPVNKNYTDFQKNLSYIKQKLQNEKTIDAANDFWIVVLENLQNLARDYYINNPSTKDAKTFKAQDSNMRDFQMAQNLMFLLKQYKNEKFICWGAQTHFIKSTEGLDNDELKTYKSMGYHLSKKYGDELYSIGFSTSKGHYGILGNNVKKVPSIVKNSIESYAENQNISEALFELSSCKQKFISSIVEYQPIDGEWGSVFNAIIYLDSVSSSHLVPNSSKYNKQAEDTVQKISHLLGKVVDENYKPIANSSVLISSQTMGAVSDADGIFILNIAHPTLNDSIRISAMGFRAVTVPLKITSDTIFYQLSQKFNQLEEVIVKATKLDAHSIVRKAIENIPQNYYRDSLSSGVLFNLFTKENDTTTLDMKVQSTIYLSEKPLSEDKIDNKLSILSKPQAIQWDKYTTKSSLNLNYKSNFIGLHYSKLNSILSAELFNKSKLKKYNFKLVNIIEKSNQKIYVLSFDCSKKSLRFTENHFIYKYNGMLYINDGDFAILKCERHWERDTSIMNGFTRKHFSKAQKNDFGGLLHSYKNLYMKTEFYKTNLYQKDGLGYFLPIYSMESTAEEGLDLLANQEFKHFHLEEFFFTNYNIKKPQKIEYKDSNYALKDIPVKKCEWIKITLPNYDK